MERRELVEGRRGPPGLTGAKAFYEAGYRQPDAAEALRLGRWREIGARAKAAHVRSLCASTGLTPRSVAEIGCGDGALLAQLRGWAPELDGFDLSASAVELARRAVPEARRIAVFDGSQVPAEDSAYDLAILSHVLEHVERPLPLLAEAARVAHEVLVEVPLEDNRSGRRPANVAESQRIGHLHLFERADVRALLEDAGLVREAELTDPLPLAHHVFRGGRARGTAKWAARRGFHTLFPRTAEQLFTVHYAVLARRP